MIRIKKNLITEYNYWIPVYENLFVNSWVLWGNISTISLLRSCSYHSLFSIATVIDWAILSSSDAGKYFLREPVCSREEPTSQHPLLSECNFCGENPDKSKSSVSLRSFYTEKLNEDKKDLKKRLKSKFVLYRSERSSAPGNFDEKWDFGLSERTK